MAKLEVKEEEEMTPKPRVKREKSQLDLTELASKLWSNTGNIDCIPHFQSLPTDLQKLIKEYKDVFIDSISDRPMDCPPT